MGIFLKKLYFLVGSYEIYVYFHKTYYDHT